MNIPVSLMLAQMYKNNFDQMNKQSRESTNTYSHRVDEPNRITLYECVREELRDENTAMYAFFKKLRDEFKIIRLKNHKDKVAELTELKAQDKLEYRFASEFLALLNEKGVNISYHLLYQENMITINDKVEFYIRSDNVDDFVKDLTIRIDNLTSENAFLAERLNDYSDRLEEEKSKLSHKLFGRRTIKNNIREMTGNLEDKQHAYEKQVSLNDSLKTILETIESNRFAFAHVLRSIMRKKEIDLLEKSVNRFDPNAFYSAQYDVKEMNDAFTIMLRENKISYEELKNTLTSLSEINNNRISGRYGNKSFTIDSGVGTIARWFVETVYKHEKEYTDEEKFERKLVQ